jgi:uncharacterized membrane protein
MIQWYYEKAGAQNGPVSLEELQQMARRGEITANTLVWNSTMSGWTAASAVAELKTLITVSSLATSVDAVPPQDPGTAPSPQPSSADPYTAPQSGFVEDIPSESSSEMPKSDQPLDAPSCIKRGWDITFRNVGNVAVCFIVFMLISWGVAFLVGMLSELIAPTSARSNVYYQQYGSGYSLRSTTTSFSFVAFCLNLVNQVVGIFLNLGLIRVCLNLVSGKAVDVSQLFGEGRKLVRACIASLIFGIVFAIGLLLLIVPGVYIALRYGQFLYAIVDKDLGIKEAFEYSSTLTKDNRMSIFVYWILAVLVVIAGLLVFCVGVFVAFPIVTIASAVVYRWLQYGQKAVMDQPGTQTPVLASYVR